MESQLRFWSKVEKTSSCWNWMSAKNNRGYGRFWLDNRFVLAHRLSYEWLVGEIRDGMELDHLCKNPTCVNPKHLEPVVHRVNILRGDTIMALEAKQGHCKNGHPLTKENCRPDKWVQGERACIICQRAYYRAWWHRNKRERC